MPQLLIEYKDKRTEITLSCGNEAYKYDTSTGRIFKLGSPYEKPQILSEPFQTNWFFKAGPYIQVKNKIVCLFPKAHELDQLLPIDVLVAQENDFEATAAVQYIHTGRSTNNNPRVSWKLFENGYKLIKF